MKSAVSTLIIAAASLALASCATGGARLAAEGARPTGDDAFYGVDGGDYPGDWGAPGSPSYGERVAHFEFSGVGLFGRGAGSGPHRDAAQAR